MPNSDLEMEFQYRDMLAQQKKYKSEKDVKADEKATRAIGGGQFVRQEKISKGASLRQKIQHRRQK